MLESKLKLIDYIKLLENKQPLIFHTIYGSFVINQN